MSRELTNGVGRPDHETGMARQEPGMLTCAIAAVVNEAGWGESARGNAFCQAVKELGRRAEAATQASHPEDQNDTARVKAHDSRSGWLQQPALEARRGAARDGRRVQRLGLFCFTKGSGPKKHEVR
eukprot:149994-Chlamydomonas_euryale.AAC.3